MRIRYVNFEAFIIDWQTDMALSVVSTAVVILNMMDVHRHYALYRFQMILFLFFLLVSKTVYQKWNPIFFHIFLINFKIKCIELSSLYHLLHLYSTFTSQYKCISLMSLKQRFSLLESCILYKSFIYQRETSQDKHLLMTRLWFKHQSRWQQFLIVR